MQELAIPEWNSLTAGIDNLVLMCFGSVSSLFHLSRDLVTFTTVFFFSFTSAVMGKTEECRGITVQVESNYNTNIVPPANSMAVLNSSFSIAKTSETPCFP